MSAPVSRIIIVACVAIEAAALFWGQSALMRFALVPAAVTEDFAGQWPALLTHAFLHGGLVHLGMNMLFLGFVGPAVEARVGGARFAALYGLGAIGGGVAQVVASPESLMPVVGASGAISAVFAAYALLYSRDEEAPATVLGVRLSEGVVRALRLGALWVGVQLLVGVAFNQGGGALGMGPVAIWAHVGGFVAGLLVALGWRRRFA